jgi:hypothetical protein
MLCHDSSYQASLTFTFLALSGPGKLVFVWCGAITAVENSQLWPWQIVFWFISRLWLICCEKKTLFHG